MMVTRFSHDIDCLIVINFCSGITFIYAKSYFYEYNSKNGI